ncbi:MAG TPA: N-acetyl-gamma-glutamyl-phosphate reductase, partial [Thermoanaerobaculia bacterium]|nr:N-acetyl-gamma-glutamyl-phosphate reductase [Thermoanaerobaculia bacterium]
MIRVSIVGAAGYSGAEAVRLLSRHPGVELAGLFGSPGGKGAQFQDLHPDLGGDSGPDVVPFSEGGLLAGRPDIAILATPNEVSAEVAPKLLAAGVRVIDVSGAFRLKDAALYPAWYGFTHPAPPLLAEAVYGLTEWCGAELDGARLVANPGCYPTSVLVALKPLASLLDPSQPVLVTSASGVSGAGKKAELAYSFCEVAGSYRAYAAGTHRHEPEMRQELGLAAGAAFAFVPHLLPLVRGILSTVHVSFAADVTDAGLAERFASAYAGRPFVKVHPAGQLPELKEVVGTPRAHVGWKLLPGGRRAVVVSAIDNLLKGAASQAVQNLNR